MRVLDKIEWPEPVSVDLLAEFRWLVGDVPVRGPSQTTVSVNAKIGTLKGGMAGKNMVTTDAIDLEIETSPYTQLFAEAHRAKLVLTSTQLAERKVQRVAEAMEHHVENTPTNNAMASPGKRRRQSSKAAELPLMTPPNVGEAVDFKAWLDEASACMAMPFAPLAGPETSSTDPREVSVANHSASPSKRPPLVGTDAATVHEARRPRASASNSTTPPVKSPEAPPVVKDDGPVPEFPQDPWVTAQLDPVTITEDLVLDLDDGPSSLPRANDTPRKFELNCNLQCAQGTGLGGQGLAKYSIEMQQRIRDTIYAHPGKDMWTDQTSSLLAAEMSADIIFGDGSEGNAAPFDTGAVVLPDPVQLEAVWIQQTAATIRDAAQTELSEGRPHAAVAVIEAGVHKLLQDDVGGAKERSSWGFNYSVAVHAHATAIQTAMRKRLACKKVRARRQRKKLVRNLRLLVKAWLIEYHSLKKRRRRLGHEHFCALTKDRWIRGYLARHRVRQLKRRLELDEVARSTRERAYIESNCAAKMASYQRQLNSASKSSALVTRRKRLTLQLKASAAQRNDARKHLPPVELRRAQIRDVFEAYDVDGSGSIDSSELKHLFDELGIAIDRRGLHDALDAMDTDQNGVVDFDEFYKWLHSSPAQRQDGRGRRRLDRPELVYLKMKLSVKNVLNRFTDSSFSQHAARLLVHEETLRQTRALGAAFREMEPPPYACRYCGIAFALYKPHWAHQRVCDKNFTRNVQGGACPEDDEVLRMSMEEKAVAAAVALVAEDVHAYVATKSGRRMLRQEVQRVKHLNARGTSEATASMSEASRLRNLFHSYDLDESGTLDRREFAEIARDLGEVTTAATFDALDVSGCGKVSYAEFADWAAIHVLAPHRRPLVRRFKCAWTRLVHGKAIQRRAEALRYVIAREKKFAEIKARRAFRDTFPPLYQCLECHADAAAIHARQNEKSASVRHRIGLTDTVRSVLGAAVQEAKEAEIDAAVQRYLQTTRGQANVTMAALRLRALRIQAHHDSATHPSAAFLAGVVRCLACADDTSDKKEQQNDVPVASVATLFRLLHRPAKEVPRAVEELDPSHSGRIAEASMVEWLQQHAMRSRRRRGVRTWKQAGRLVELSNYRHHLTSGALEWMDEDQDLVSKHEMDAWIRRFNAYCSSIDGKGALAKATAALKQLDGAMKRPIESRADFVMTALEMQDGGTCRRLGQRELLHAMAAVGWLVSDRHLGAAMDPDKTGVITREAFAAWYPSVHVFEKCSDVRLAVQMKTALNTAALSRAVLAVQFDRRECGATLPKSEDYCASAVGMKEVQNEAKRIAHLWRISPRRRWLPSDPTTRVAFAFDVIGSARSVHGSAVAGLLYFAHCPCDESSVSSLLPRRDGRVHEADVMRWLVGRRQVQGEGVVKRLATRLGSLCRKDKVLCLARVVVQHRWQDAAGAPQ